MTDIKQ